MLRLILASSSDGYLARGPEDRMEWPSHSDKAAFRLLTSVNGTLGVGARSWALMPQELKGRHVVPITQDGRMVQNHQGFMEASVTLGRFAHMFPGAWLLGGPTLALEALEVGLVGETFLVRSQVHLGRGIKDGVTPWIATRGEVDNLDVPWHCRQRVVIGDVQVDCWAKLNACF